MDWSNERYVRIYTRDTADLLAVGWEGRLVWFEILRKCDRAGVFDSADPAVLAELLRIPREVADVGISRLIERGCLDVTNRDDLSRSQILVPNFIEAQEAKQSDKQRQQESRLRRRDAARSLPVTKRDTSVTKRDENVTTGHDVSHPVTPSLAVPSLAKPSLTNILGGDSSELARFGIALLNELTGGRYRVGKAVKAQFDAISKDYGKEEVELVIRAKHAEWGKDPEMAKHVNPITLFRPGNFARYVDGTVGAPEIPVDRNLTHGVHRLDPAKVYIEGEVKL